MYRSKVWRTRLDATTNWAVATTGIALSVAFSSAGNSPLPLVLVALMALMFLAIEARRYRYFDIWRTRVRLMEVSIGPLMLVMGPGRYRFKHYLSIGSGMAVIAWLLTTFVTPLVWRF